VNPEGPRPGYSQSSQKAKAGYEYEEQADAMTDLQILAPVSKVFVNQLTSQRDQQEENPNQVQQLVGMIRNHAPILAEQSAL